MPEMHAASVEQHTMHAGLFGGNILTHRDRIGDDGTYDELAEELGITGIRYPGGAVTEFYFDISDPDRTSGVHPHTGEEHTLIPYSSFLSWAADTSMPVTVVLPTREFLSEDTDENGDRFPEFDEALLRSFIRDTVTGAYGDAEIEGFEIGNEYWGSGEMSSVEYGRLSSEMAAIIDDELDSLGHGEIPIITQVGASHGFADLSLDYEHLGTGEEQLQAVALDYGLLLNSEDHLYNGGGVNWTKIANELVMKEFDTPEERDALDAIAAHVYSKAPVFPGSRHFVLNSIEQTWLQDHPDLEIFVTEWNQKAHTDAFDAEEDYGLKQAAEMLYIVDEMSDHGVDIAHVWPLQQSAKSALSYGHDFEELSPAGEMFKMMRENLPGKQQIDLATDGSEGDTSADVLSFYGDNELVVYVMSRSEGTTMEDLGMNAIIADYDQLEITRLGVEAGQSPGSTQSNAEIDILDPSEYYVDGTIQADLDGFEIMQLVFSDVVLTPEVEALIEGGDDDTDPILPPIDPVEPEEPEEPDEPDAEADAEGAGLAIEAILAAAIVPLFLLLVA